VIDCEARAYSGALPVELPGVAGVLIDEEHDLRFSSDRGAARVSVFRCSDEQLLGQTEVGAHPNGLAYDRQRRRLYSFNLGDPLGENCTASVIDLASQRLVATLPLPGRPRWAVYDHERDVVYANIQQPAKILVIELYVAIGDPGVVCSFDSERLEQLETVATEQGAHTSGWDPVSRALYVFCPASSGAAVYEERA
jgi:DNA-binding beta-propeller fold protein YncE